MPRVHLRHEKCRFGPSRFSFELPFQTERTQRSAEERATKNPVILWWLWCLDSALTPPNCIFLCRSLWLPHGNCIWEKPLMLLLPVECVSIINLPSESPLMRECFWFLTWIWYRLSSVSSEGGIFHARITCNSFPWSSKKPAKHRIFTPLPCGAVGWFA